MPSIIHSQASSYDSNTMMLQHMETQEHVAVEDRLALQDYIALVMGSIPEIEAVFTAGDGKGIWHVWVVVANPDVEIRKKIYDKEKSVIDDFDGFDFDFNILASRGVDPVSVIRDPSARLVYKR